MNARSIEIVAEDLGMNPQNLGHELHDMFVAEMRYDKDCGGYMLRCSIDVRSLDGSVGVFSIGAGIAGRRLFMAGKRFSRKTLEECAGMAAASCVAVEREKCLTELARRKSAGERY